MGDKVPAGKGGQVPIPSKPTTPTPQIVYGPNANKEVVSDYTEQVLKGALTASNNKKATISSTSRDPYNQARVMYENLKTKGIDAQKDLYGPNGDKVIDVYNISSKNAGKTKEMVIGDMTDKINELGPSNVSRHCADPNGLGVVDVEPSSITNKDEFINALKADQRVSRVITPSEGDPAYHIEIPQTGITVTSLEERACCSGRPTPFNAGELCKDGCSYYQKRYDDYVLRHSCCKSKSSPPDYYLDYGLKYCEKFTLKTYPKLSPEGQQWLKKARCNLQIMMEKGLQNKPELELNSEKFRKFAFDTHPKSYLDAGLANLNPKDWFYISTTPELKEWLKLETWEQAIEAGTGVTEKKIKDTFEWTEEQAKNFQNWTEEQVKDFQNWLKNSFDKEN